MTVAKNEKPVSTRDAAARIGCCTSTVHNLINRGDLKAFAFSDPGWYHIYPDSLDAYLRRIHGNGAKKNGHGRTKSKPKKGGAR